MEGQWPEADRVSPFAHVIKKREAHEKSKSWAGEISDGLKQSHSVRFADKQIPKRRVKRSALSFNDPFWPKTWYMVCILHFHVTNINFNE